MHDQRAPVQGLVDQLRAGVEAQRLGELVDLVAVQVPGAGVFAGVEMARQRADFLADVDGRQFVGVCNVRGGFRAGAEKDYGKRHQPGGFRVNAGGGDAHGREGGLLLGGEVVQSGLEFLAGARVAVVLAGVLLGSCGGVVLGGGVVVRRGTA